MEHADYFQTKEDWDYRVHLISLHIDNSRDIYHYTEAMIKRFTAMVKRGEKPTYEMVRNRPEFFTIRVMVNRKVIDLEGIYPTTAQLNEALDKHALYVLECAECEAAQSA